MNYSKCCLCIGAISGNKCGFGASVQGLITGFFVSGDLILGFVREF